LRRVAEVRHLRPSRDHVSGDLEIQILSSASSSRSDPQSDGRQESVAGVSSESKRTVALRYFLTGRVVSFGGGRRYVGEGGARRGLRHDEGRMKRVEGEKNGGRELLEKRRGTNASL
jgi:hypothetical protein